MLRRAILKISRNGQITIPAAVRSHCGNPTHAEMIYRDGFIGLFPASLITWQDQAKTLGVPEAVMREARRIVAERRAADRAQPAPAEPGQTTGA